MKTFLAAALLAVALPAAVTARAAVLSGSDLAGPAIAPVLGKAAVTGNFTGTFDALRDLRAGKCAAALIFLREGERLPEVAAGTWLSAPVAYQPIYVAVNRANHATEIDLPTLAGIYGKTNDTKFDTWRCLPASGLTQGPLAIAPHPGKGLTVSQFRSVALAGGEYRPNIRFASGDDDAESRALTSINGVVLLSRPPVSGNLKLLSVADGRQGKPTRAYQPTASSLHSGDYPLRVTLTLVYPKAGADTAAAVRAVLGNEAAKLFEAKGLAPAPENIRRKFTQSLDSGA